MIEGTEKPKIPLKFAKRAARYNEFGYNRPIITHAQILVHRWGPRTRILVLFLRQTQPEFSFVWCRLIAILLLGCCYGFMSELVTAADILQLFQYEKNTS